MRAVKKVTKSAALFTVLLISTQVSAGLFDRGNGLIYDDYLDITWLADANYAETSGYAAANATGVEHSDPNNIQSNGQMGWAAANAWADQLIYEGYDDWRLANTNPFDTNCSENFTPTGYDTRYAGYGCIESELGHLYFEDMGLTNGDDMSTNTLGLFTNIQDFVYWTGTECEYSLDCAWGFNSFNGFQNDFGSEGSSFFAWAVLDGDVTNNVPEPSSLSLFGLVLLVIRLRRRYR